MDLEEDRPILGNAAPAGPRPYSPWHRGGISLFGLGITLLAAAGAVAWIGRRSRLPKAEPEAQVHSSWAAFLRQEELEKSVEAVTPAKVARPRKALEDVTDAEPAEETQRKDMALLAKLQSARDATQKKVSEELAEAEERAKEGSRQKAAAEALGKKAKEEQARVQDETEKSVSLKANAEAAVTKAAQMELEANNTISTARTDIQSANQEAREAATATRTAKAREVEADKEVAAAQDIENQALRGVAKHRICVDLPGVRLQGTEATFFSPIVVRNDTTSSEQCTAWCHSHGNCGQTIFSAGNKGCYLFRQPTSEIIEFSDLYNSSYCGATEQEKDLMAIVKAVYARKPYVPPLIKCSWSGDDCRWTKCCNDVAWSAGLSNPQGFTCYKKDPNFAGCKKSSDGPPAWYQGAVLGGPRAPREIKSADAGVMLQGTSLFCFAVVQWHAPAAKPYWDSEGAVANNWKTKGVGIYECDEHAMYEGQSLPVRYSADGNPVIANTDVFLAVWKQVAADGLWAKHDWTVKTDPDSVFFPQRLRQHIHKLRTPLGSRVYLRNSEDGFQFHGALEVMTKEAVDLFIREGSTCRKPTQVSGEDFYMRNCLDALGVDHQTDLEILQEGPTVDCNNKWTAAFHFFRSVKSWNDCRFTIKEQPPADVEEAKPPVMTVKVEAATSTPWAMDAQSLESQARTAAASAAAHLKIAQAAVASAKSQADKANATKVTAEGQIADATAATAKAKAMRSQSAKDIVEAKALNAKADTESADAATLSQQAQNGLAVASAIGMKADAMRKRAEGELDVVETRLAEGKKQVAKGRMCVDLPGVRLNSGAGPMDPIVGDSDVATPEQCTQRCQEDPNCGQSIWAWGNKGCYMSVGNTLDVIEYKDGFNSSYCDFVKGKEMLLKNLHAIFDAKPYVPPLVQCSWGGDDCAKTKCCNDVKCDVNFTKCDGYTCYQKDKYFASCRVTSPPPNWVGDVVGGPRQVREIPPAPKGVKVQGTSLFCFSVVSWYAGPVKPFWDAEAKLAGNIKTNKVHIYQCDEHAFFSGGQTGKAAWGSYSNIDSFVAVWRNVRDDGRWRNHDWTVKVDADAVFFPHRLKDHLFKLRTPQGSRVYLKNINYRFQFMGALEVLTREALEIYFKDGDQCIRGKHDGGEDFFMKGCLDGIGVDHQTDFELLRDRYCLTCPDRDDPCSDGWRVAYHYRKKVISWNWCYNEAVCGNKAGSCDQGIPVEFVM